MIMITTIMKTTKTTRGEACPPDEHARYQRLVRSATYMLFYIIS